MATLNQWKESRFEHDSINDCCQRNCNRQNFRAEEKWRIEILFTGFYMNVGKNSISRAEIPATTQLP